VWLLARGCPSCRGLGYKGRLAIHELLEVTSAIRDLISQRAPDHVIRDAAQSAGMRTLVQDGIAKAAEGLTTLDEIVRVAPHMEGSTAGERRERAPAAPAPAPAARLHAPPAPPEDARAAAGAGAGSRGRVLIVDDSATVLEVVRYFLSLEGYEVFSASDGLEGLELARRVQPDAVVSDVEMPQMDGKALVRALRDDPATRDIPIMLLTSQTAIECEAEGLGVGADDYVPKPVEPRRLAARLKALLSRSRRLRGVACS
jgi:CheY-like chemotaxis protein